MEPEYCQLDVEVGLFFSALAVVAEPNSLRPTGTEFIHHVQAPHLSLVVLSVLQPL